VDIRGLGGYVVGPGSLHPEGIQYEWEIPPSEIPPAAVPPALAALLAKKPSPTETAVRSTPSFAPVIERRTRNSTLFQLACSLRGTSGLAFEEAFAAVADANQRRCQPPLRDDEIGRIVSSACRYDTPPRSGQPTPSRSPQTRPWAARSATC